MTAKHTMSLCAAVALAFAVSACNQAAEPAAAEPISDADAAGIADSTVETWMSMDAARIKALYAPTVVAFDFSAPDLVTDRTAFDEIQDGFAAAKFDAATQLSRDIKVLDADTIVMNGAWDISSSSIPENKASVRCTDVFEKDEAGNWLIVSEHCSPVPAEA
jgi:ketosteroid isomerase-like protein